jgi:hypothetical protein
MQLFNLFIRRRQQPEPAMPPQQIIERDITTLRPYARNARIHSRKQVKQIAASIERFGFTNPVLVSDAGEIIAGHGRVEAARLLGMTKVPTLERWLPECRGLDRGPAVSCHRKLCAF